MTEEIKNQMGEAYGLVREAKEELGKAKYEVCIRLLFQAKDILENISISLIRPFQTSS